MLTILTDLIPVVSTILASVCCLVCVLWMDQNSTRGAFGRIVFGATLEFAGVVVFLEGNYLTAVLLFANGALIVLSGIYIRWYESQKEKNSVLFKALYMSAFVGILWRVASYAPFDENSAQEIMQIFVLFICSGFYVGEFCVRRKIEK